MKPHSPNYPTPRGRRELPFSGGALRKLVDRVTLKGEWKENGEEGKEVSRNSGSHSLPPKSSRHLLGPSGWSP